MTVTTLNTDGITVGDRLKVIALCSKVEILQNLTSVGSHRQIYHLHGEKGSYISAIIFKPATNPDFDINVFRDEPVLVDGVVGEYKGVLQLHIEAITPIGTQVDKNDLLAEMSDPRLVDLVNDELYKFESFTVLTRQHLTPPLGLDNALAGTLPLRLAKFILMVKPYYTEQINEYVDNIAILIEYYLNKEGTFDDRLEVIKTVDTTLIRALLFNHNAYPEHEEFVKLHHLIMQPKNVKVEVTNILFKEITHDA